MTSTTRLHRLFRLVGVLILASTAHTLPLPAPASQWPAEDSKRKSGINSELGSHIGLFCIVFFSTFCGLSVLLYPVWWYMKAKYRMKATDEARG